MRATTADFDPLTGPRAALAREIPRRPRVVWWMGALFAIAFALVAMPTILAERWLGATHVEHGKPAPITVRVPQFAGANVERDDGVGVYHVDGGVLLARGETDAGRTEIATKLEASQPTGPVPYAAFFLLMAVLAGIFTHHTRRSNRGRLIRVQVVSLALIALAAVVVKLVMMTTAVSVLAMPVAVFAIVPTLVLDRIVGLAVGTLAALVVSMLVPFDVGVAILLLCQAGAAGLVVDEQPKRRTRAVVIAGAIATVLTALTYPLLVYLSSGHLPLSELQDPLRSAWIASAIGPALATALSLLLTPLYQLMVGEITAGRLIHLEDLSHPLLRQISERAPGTWQHSLTMANMAEIAANAIGANGRLVRVGAYFHDLGKSLAPKYFIENLEPGETSPHDKMPPEASCDAIFAHVTEGIVAARKARLHERIIDFMHMHHGNGVLEYFWAKCQEQSNPKKLTIEYFRYPGVPPQSRETAILAICDAVEAASRTIKKSDPAMIDTLVTRIVYGKLHLGQLDESGLSMRDLRKMSDSLRETIRHANHGRIEYPWQKAQQDASAPGTSVEGTAPRLDSLDRPAKPDTVRPPRAARDSEDALAETAPSRSGETPNLRKPDAEGKSIAETAPATREPSKARKDVQAEVARVLGVEPQPKTDDASRAASWRAADAGKSMAESNMRPTLPGTGPLEERAKRSSRAPEVKEFAAEAKQALDNISSERAAMPRDPEVRKRAATIPPVPGRRSPTMPPLPGQRPPTIPPPTYVGHAPGPIDLKSTVTGPAPGPKLPAVIVSSGEHSIPDSAITQPRMAASDDDSARTNPAMQRLPTGTEPDDTQPRMQLPLLAPNSDPAIIVGAVPRGDLAPRREPNPSWARGLAARIDAAIDDDFGGETPVIPPTKAELQALLGTPLDKTRVQSADEIEALHLATRDRQSDQELELKAPRRAPFPTAEIDDADIEAAIELAPPARKTSQSIGIVKKKPGE